MHKARTIEGDLDKPLILYVAGNGSGLNFISSERKGRKSTGTQAMKYTSVYVIENDRLEDKGAITFWLLILANRWMRKKSGSS